jgi:hypothetical protein
LISPGDAAFSLVSFHFFIQSKSPVAKWESLKLRGHLRWRRRLQFTRTTHKKWGIFIWIVAYMERHGPWSTQRVEHAKKNWRFVQLKSQILVTEKNLNTKRGVRLQYIPGQARKGIHGIPHLDALTNIKLPMNSYDFPSHWL